jgi:hypothetical protein
VTAESELAGFIAKLAPEMQCRIMAAGRSWRHGVALLGGVLILVDRRLLSFLWLSSPPLGSGFE